jgi:hypothetical protein
MTFVEGKYRGTTLYYHVQAELGKLYKSDS